MKHFVFTSAQPTSDKIPKSWEFFSRQIQELVYIMMWGPWGGETVSGEETDLIMIHYELLQETSRQRSPQLSPYLALYWQHGSAISALSSGRKLSLSTLLIYFPNCQSHLMGEILKSLIFTLTQPRPTGWLSPMFSHIPNSRRLYLFLVDTLKHQDDSVLYWALSVFAIWILSLWNKYKA